jgi:hypothetical protein
VICRVRDEFGGILATPSKRRVMGGKYRETTVKIAEDREVSSPLQGQVLRRSEWREVAIFMLDDTLWVADFVDGQGELVDAVTWFRFNCAAASAQARRRMGLESALPLSDELVARIEALYRSGAERAR